MFHLNARVSVLLVIFAMIMTVTATPLLRVPPAQERALIKQQRALTNAQRMARGLPLNKPKRHYDRQSAIYFLDMHLSYVN